MDRRRHSFNSGRTPQLGSADGGRVIIKAREMARRIWSVFAIRRLTPNAIFHSSDLRGRASADLPYGPRGMTGRSLPHSSES
jgi:hypothetical protein